MPHRLTRRLAALAESRSQRALRRLVMAKQSLRDAEEQTEDHARRATHAETDALDAAVTGSTLELIYSHRARTAFQRSALEQTIDHCRAGVLRAANDQRERDRDTRVREAVADHYGALHLIELENAEERERDDQFAARYAFRA